MIVRIYHKEQAYISRLIAGAVVVCTGAFAYLEMSTSRLLGGAAFPERLQVLGFPDNWGQVVGLLFLLGAVVGGYVLLNRPRVVDFLSSVETELRKVSWPTRQQVVGSAAVVIITMLALGTYLFLIDTMLTWIIRRALRG